MIVIIITDHAAVRFLQRHEGCNLNHAIRNYSDKEILEYIERQTDLATKDLKNYMIRLFQTKGVGNYGNAQYSIGNKCKAVFVDGTIVSVIKRGY